MLKFKVGDKVQVVANNRGHGFVWGTVGTVFELYQNDADPHYMVHDGSAFWYLGDDELIAYND